MDDLTIIIGGQAFGGWQDIRVARGAERVPSGFDLTATERYPGQIGNVAISAGSACQVKIGADLVLTGYVDRVMPSISAGQHSIRIQGRSKVEDIVDCSVTNNDIAGLQRTVGDLVSFATAICKPFGISVRSLTGDNVPVSLPGGGAVPIAVVFGETGYEVIERVARYVQVLVYDDTDGSLILARAGAAQMASGFQEGVNVQAASGSLSMDQRYSDYLPAIMSYQLYGQPGSGQANLPVVKDKSVPRYRPLYVVSEQVTLGQALAEQRATWEMARRYGRSQAVRIVTDSWRDSAGALWQPNAYASVYMPSIKCAPKEQWLIADVTFSRGLDRGTTAELTLMPKEAFTQEPIILLPFGWYQDDGKGSTGAGPVVGAGHGDLA